MPSLFARFRTFFSHYLEPKAAPDRAILVFHHTGEVIKAEEALKAQGFAVDVKGPPAHLRTGCDLVIEFPLMMLARVQQCLEALKIAPMQIVPVQEVLLEPVNLCQLTDYGQWFMVRAANMKITFDKESGEVVNISGGGCPDVPYLAHELVGLQIMTMPEPRLLGHTLCSYALQKAYEEALIHWKQIHPTQERV